MTSPIPTIEGRPGPSVHFDQFALSYGSQQVLAPLNLQIESGSLHALIGPNGGGKTSLLRSLLGLTPHQGTIRLEWPAEQVIGYVPQALEMDLNLPLTVKNFLSLSSQQRPVFWGGRPKLHQQIQYILTQIGLPDVADQQLGHLSGGQRQRVLFAQALLRPPNLLLLDEPLTGLDESGTKIVDELLQNLRAQGVTQIWIHHDLEHVRRRADRVSCLNGGLLFEGKPHEVLTEANLLRMFAGRSSTEVP